MSFFLLGTPGASQTGVRAPCDPPKKINPEGVIFLSLTVTPKNDIIVEQHIRERQVVYLTMESELDRLFWMTQEANSGRQTRRTLEEMTENGRKEMMRMHEERLREAPVVKPNMSAENMERIFRETWKRIEDVRSQMEWKAMRFAMEVCSK